MSAEWPEVLPDDDGIRPAGSPDRCFYCGRLVGRPHGTDCVCVVKRVRYRVLVGGVPMGYFEHDDPHFWTMEEGEFHKNESSWCANNAVGLVAWDDKVAADADAAMTPPTDGCLCQVLDFEFDSVVDPGPNRSHE